MKILGLAINIYLIFIYFISAVLNILSNDTPNFIINSIVLITLITSLVTLILDIIDERAIN